MTELKVAPKVDKYLGSLQKTICSQELFKMAQSGQTGSNTPCLNGPIWSHWFQYTMSQCHKEILECLDSLWHARCV